MNQIQWGFKLSDQLEFMLAASTCCPDIWFPSCCSEKIEVLNLKPASVKTSLTGGMSKVFPDLNSIEIFHLNSLCNKALDSHFGEPCSSSAKIACALEGNVEPQILRAIS